MSERRKLSANDVLSEALRFPNDDAARRLNQLVGLDEHIATLTRDLRLIFDPEIVEDWSAKNYGRRLSVVDLVKDAVPLIVFQGDVGTGKSALAETIGQRVAEVGGYGLQLVKMNTRVRGTGYVGEMGTLLADSFKHVENVWDKSGEPVLLVIDEADSLLTTREAASQHHEDKSGVNTILQHLDQFRTGHAQVAVIAITNRDHVLDPAIRRRATLVLSFERPNRSDCDKLLRQLFCGALTDREIGTLVEVTEEVRRRGNKTPFTYSDLTLRFAIPVVREAVGKDTKLDPTSLTRMLNQLIPTPAALSGQRD